MKYILLQLNPAGSEEPYQIVGHYDESQKETALFNLKNQQLYKGKAILVGYDDGVQITFNTNMGLNFITLELNKDDFAG